jgi:hypothetical protein
MGWWMRLTPVLWKRTLCAAHRVRNSSLCVESAPTRFERARSYGSRLAFERRAATTSFATRSQSIKKLGARGSRKTKWAVFTGRAGLVGVEGVPELVGGKDVPAPVANIRWCCAHRVQDALHARPYLLLAHAPTRRGRRMCAREVEQVRSLCLVELKRTG